MKEAESIFRNRLKEQGLRWTPERRLILDEIVTYNGHFDVDDLHFRLKKKSEKISRASIYRTLPLLVECALVKEIVDGQDHAHYEYNYGRQHHDHLFCKKCGRSIEFLEEKIEALQEKICKKHNFSATRHFMVIEGICDRCQKRKKKK